jgi:hypothetical protein
MSIEPNADLTALLARRVMGWEVAPDRFLMGRRQWMPRWRFQPAENLEDAFRLVDAAAPQKFTLSREGAGPFCVTVRIGGKIGQAQDRSQPRAITFAICRALRIEVER